jgi:putative MATE family efflux protein
MNRVKKRWILTQEQTKFVKEVTMIGAPVIVQSFFSSMVNMLDVFMIGHLGETAITAVSIGNQWFVLFSLLINGINAAGSMFISQYWGKREKKSIHQYMGILIYGGVILSLLFLFSSLFAPSFIMNLYSKDPLVISEGIGYIRITGLSYLIFAITGVMVTGLRGIGITKIPMLTSMCSVVVDGILNYILIFGNFGAPAYGVKGAAIAIVAARAVEVICVSIYIILKKPYVYGRLKEFLHIPGYVVSKYFRYGALILLGEVAFAIGNNLFNIAYKYTGTQSQAALQIVNSLQSLAMLFCGGFGTAAAVLLGTMLGRNCLDKAKRYCKWLLVFCLVISCTISFILMILAPLILQFFHIDKGLKHSLYIMVIILAAALPLRMEVFLCIVGILRSGGDSVFCFFANIFGVWCIGLPLVFITAVYLKLPVYVVYLMSTAQEVGKFVICFQRVIRYKWLRNLTGS